MAEGQSGPRSVAHSQSASLTSQLDEILKQAIHAQASDIHIRVGNHIRIRRLGSMELLPGFPKPTPNDTASIAARLLLQARRAQKDTVLRMVRDLEDLDCSFSASGARFRVNIGRQRGTLEMVLRVVSDQVPDLTSLHLPEVLKKISLAERGLVLVTGVTGSGKSTTLAAMIHHINSNRQRKIITIEDPIEYLHSDVRSAVSQREVGSDTESFNTALRAALRQDPDVIMVGEMRDRETIEIAIKAAETGHLVFSTLHTQDAMRSVSRIISMFDKSEQTEARLRLADSIHAVISQRLLPMAGGTGRIAAMEIMIATLAIKACIEDPGKGGMMDLIKRGQEAGMQTFDQHLTSLYKQELIRLETAKAAATSPSDFERNLAFS